jgi:two-component system sensor histidine kinase KdpD
MRQEADIEPWVLAGALGAIALSVVLIPLRALTSAANLAFVFMGLTIVVAELGGRAAALVTALVSAMSLNFFLMEPYLTLTISKADDLVAFLALAACGLIAAAFGRRRAHWSALAGRAVEELDVVKAVVDRLRDGAPLDEILADLRRRFGLRAIALRDEDEGILAFAVMLAVGLVISGLTVRIRTQALAAREREQRTAALYAMSRELASTRGVEALLAIAARHVGEVFRAQVAVLLADGATPLAPRSGLPGGFEVDAKELGVARWVLEHRQPAGLGTGTLPGASALYLPLLASRGPVGVLGVRPADRHGLDTPEQLHQLETLANQTALAIERALLAEETQATQVRMETERLRSSLLSAVSHDLRTPLATITGAVSAILESGARLDPQTRQELLESVREEAEHLNRLVQNLLEMTRLESGALQLRREWHPLEEVIGAALNRLARRLAGRRVTTRVPPDLPLVAIDDVLVEQVLINLLDNALKYTPPGSPIEVIATATDRAVTVEVADRGPGLPPGQEDKVFDKFHRAQPDGGRGAGLGLAICRGIVRAHGGRIWAHNLPGGGVAFLFALPIGETPPAAVAADA